MKITFEYKDIDSKHGPYTERCSVHKLKIHTLEDTLFGSLWLCSLMQPNIEQIPIGYNTYAIERNLIKRSNKYIFADDNRLEGV